MRLIDADELLKDIIGMEDGWMKPPKGCHSVIDLIKTAPMPNANTVLINPISADLLYLPCILTVELAISSKLFRRIIIGQRPYPNA